MTKLVQKSLSFSIAALVAAASASALEHNPAAQVASMSIEAMSSVCATQADVERGWEYQYALLEARLEAKGAQNAALPGTIVTSPFEDVVPYRSDGTARNARKNVKTSGRATNDGVSHF